MLNQCDGCRRGLPIVNGLHEGQGYDKMCCTKNLYGEYMKKKRSPNSPYWRKKADEIFMAPFRGQPCEVCGTDQGTCFHHIVAKGRSKALRYDVRNGIVVCYAHHTMGNTMAPHATNQLAVERFIEWFKDTHPDRHAWVVENEYIIRRYTYQQAFENMKAGRQAWEDE